MPSLTYNWAINVIIKNTIICNVINDIYNSSDIEVVICIILVLFKRADDVSYYVNIR
jgi:hypothetical protein